MKELFSLASLKFVDGHVEESILMSQFRRWFIIEHDKFVLLLRVYTLLVFFLIPFIL